MLLIAIVDQRVQAIPARHIAATATITAVRAARARGSRLKQPTPGHHGLIGCRFWLDRGFHLSAYEKGEQPGRHSPNQRAALM